MKSIAGSTRFRRAESPAAEQSGLRVNFSKEAVCGRRFVDEEDVCVRSLGGACSVLLRVQRPGRCAEEIHLDRFGVPVRRGGRRQVLLADYCHDRPEGYRPSARLLDSQHFWRQAGWCRSGYRGGLRSSLRMWLRMEQGIIRGCGDEFVRRGSLERVRDQACHDKHYFPLSMLPSHHRKATSRPQSLPAADP